jgi:hypothetical protein
LQNFRIPTLCRAFTSLKKLPLPFASLRASTPCHAFTSLKKLPLPFADFRIPTLLPRIHFTKKIVRFLCKTFIPLVRSTLSAQKLPLLTLRIFCTIQNECFAVYFGKISNST